MSESAINWISTAFFLAFVAVFPLTIFVLHKSLKIAFITAGTLILIGNWIRYGGATSRSGGSFAHAMAGEIVIGFAQPFILAAPTRYSDLWFTNRGRVAATAVMSLANPLGAALGQLINPFWVSETGDVSNMVLYVSIIVSHHQVYALCGHPLTGGCSRLSARCQLFSSQQHPLHLSDLLRRHQSSVFASLLAQC